MNVWKEFGVRDVCTDWVSAASNAIVFCPDVNFSGGLSSEMD